MRLYIRSIGMFVGILNTIPYLQNSHCLIGTLFINLVTLCWVLHKFIRDLENSCKIMYVHTFGNLNCCTHAAGETGPYNAYLTNWIFNPSSSSTTTTSCNPNEPRSSSATVIHVSTSIYDWPGFGWYRKRTTLGPVKTGCRLNIIIITWVNICNGQICMASFYKCTHSNLVVILVDNCEPKVILFDGTILKSEINTDR